jgi:hypothetical protein
MGNNLQDWSAEGGATMMQALDSWLDHPPERADQLASLNPATGIELAYDLYGARFFELYLPDLDGAAEGALDAAGRPIIDDLRYWNDFLTAGNTETSPADFNQDGEVDAADLPHWQDGFGRISGATGTHGDADGDEDVDGADFLAWQREHGSGGSTTATAVPEPAMLLLAAVVFMTAISLVRGSDSECREAALVPANALDEQRRADA